jgi:hypothetical protein
LTLYDMQFIYIYNLCCWRAIYAQFTSYYYTITQTKLIHYYWTLCQCFFLQQNVFIFLLRKNTQPIIEKAFSNISYSCNQSNMNRWWLTIKCIIFYLICYVEIQLHRVSKFVVLMFIFFIWQLFVFQYQITSIKSDTFNNITKLYRLSIFLLFCWHYMTYSRWLNNQLRFYSLI